jgi:outer membrane protein assembly factor BamB
VRTRLVVLSIVALVACLTPRASSTTRIGPSDWPMYGRNVGHTFAGSTTLTTSTVKTLAPRWFFQTGDVVSANPVEVAGVIYVGSWDGNFYAIDAQNGTLKWKYRVKDQPAITPQPGNRQPSDVTSDGGIITSSAVFAPGAGSRPDLVIFGGGYTLYALRAADGKPYWSRDFTGRPDKPADPAHDETRIFSSPVVVGDRVLFAVTPDSTPGFHGYAVAADLATGRELWHLDTDVDAKGTVLNDGCGGIWSSPTIVAAYGIAVYDVADCNFSNPHPFDEKVFAVQYSTGHLAWVFDPLRADNGCDWDFGATANLVTTRSGVPLFLGVGGKDGTYYSIDPKTGRGRWKNNVVFGGYSGGFIGTAATDGHHVYGATAIGDFGRFEGVGDTGCDLGNPGDLPAQEPSLHAFDFATGDTLWEENVTPSLGPTSVANGMTFVCANLLPQNPFQRIDVRNAATGLPVAEIPLAVGCTSGVVEVGNTLFIGTGTNEEPQPAGVWAYTPEGGAVTIPR